MRLVDSDRTDDDTTDDDNEDEALAIARLPTAEAVRCAATESIVQCFDGQCRFTMSSHDPCLLPGLKHLWSHGSVSSSFWGSAL